MLVRLLLGLLLVCACRTGEDTERSAMLPALCEEYCPRRVMCVDDGFASADVELCTRMCEGEERYVLDNACGEASFAVLECMAGLSCEELPVATAALERSDEAAGCYAEQALQRDECDFWIER